MLNLAIGVWDRLYRRWHALDDPESRVPPVLSCGIARVWRRHHLPDGTILERGALYGELHVHNAEVIRLCRDGLSPVQRALRFRLEFHASLVTLAQLTDGPLARLEAFSAVTIFDRGLHRLGFDVEPAGLIAPRVAGAYQRALLLTLAAPAARHRLAPAQRLWISRRRLRALYGVHARAS